MELLDRSLSDIATTIPGASALLRNLKLNFCCDGITTLGTALAGKGLPSHDVVDQLLSMASDAEPVDWSKEPTTRLISHILERYHARHREQLPELIFLAAKVERVHANAPGCPLGLADLLRNISHELASHMLKEEQILFPMLGGGIYPNGPINVMQDEHEEHLQAVEQLRQLTNDITLPAGACNSWKALYLGLQTFVDDLMQHITLENYFLFVPPKATSSNCCGSCQ